MEDLTSLLKLSYTTARTKLVTKYTPNSTYRTKNKLYHRDSLKGKIHNVGFKSIIYIEIKVELTLTK